MNDEAIAAGFDGRPSVEIIVPGLTAHRIDHITWIATELGYALCGEEMRGRGAIRLNFIRDDSPTARQRAQAAIARVQAAENWQALATQNWSVSQASDPHLVTPLRAAKATRETKGSEGLHPSQVVITFTFGALVCFSMALAAHDSAAVSMASCVIGALFVIGAVLGPRYARNRQKRNLELLEKFRQQEAARFWVPPPPPPPPLPPASPPHDQTGM
ncbi:hypothetical protein [Streptomyces noursei]|uniref:hypothetical protein n=1 Tax=Streptomyces noursei TaxID=1971 RepID=UPI0011DDAC1E|nr:hypothetical protein [Streptomyces noursei]